MAARQGRVGGGAIWEQARAIVLPDQHEKALVDIGREKPDSDSQQHAVDMRQKLQRWRRIPMVTDRRSARLERLEPRALSRRIVDQLKRVIIAGELHPGDRVLETDLAEQLGVSRGPVREAFRQLEQEGLLVSYPHRGTFVATVPDDEIDEVYALRAHLEAYAARRVVTERREEALPILSELVEQMVTAAQAKDLPGLADLDLQFHD